MDYAALAKVLHEIMPDSVSEVERYLTCFSCFYHLKNIIEKKGWKYPHAAYANNLAALSRLYDEAELQLLDAVDAQLPVAVFAVGLHCAGLSLRLLCELSRAEPLGQGIADLALRVCEHGIASQEILINGRIKLLFSQICQAVDLLLRGAQSLLRALHLLLQIGIFALKLLGSEAEMVGALVSGLLFRFEIGDRLLVELQLRRNGLQFVEGHLRAAALVLEPLDVTQDGSQISAGVKETTGRGERHQQQKQCAGLQPALEQGAVIVALGDQHRQIVRLRVPAGHRERLRNADKGKL